MADDKVKLLTTEHLESIFNKDKTYADRKVKTVSDCIALRRFDGVFSNLTEADSNWSEGKIFFIESEYAFKRCVDTDSGFEDAGVEYNTDVSYIPSGITGARKGLTANEGLYVVDSGDSITFYRVSVPATNKAKINGIDLVVEEAPSFVIKLSDSPTFLRDNCDTGTLVYSKKPDFTTYNLKIQKFFNAFLSDTSIANAWKWSNIQFVTGCKNYPQFWRIDEIDNTDAESITLYIRNGEERYLVTIEQMDRFMMRGFQISIYSV